MSFNLLARAVLLAIRLSSSSQLIAYLLVCTIIRKSDYIDLIIIFMPIFQLQAILTWILIGFKHYQVMRICVIESVLSEGVA